MKRILLLLILAILLQAQNNTPVQETDSTDTNSSFEEQPLNISSLNSTTQAELNACLQIVKESKTIIGQYSWSWGYISYQPNQYRAFYLYFKVKDSKDNSREVEVIIAVEDKVYTLLSVNQNILNSNIQNGTQAPFEPITRPLFIPSSTAIPNTYNDLIRDYSNNYDQLTSGQIQQDSALSSLSLEITKSYPMIKNHQISAVFSKQLSQLSTAYILFYLNASSNDLWSVYGIVDNIKKLHYIISVNQIDTSTIGKE